jgi:hypothetical protein
MNKITLPSDLHPEEKLKIISEVYGKIEAMIMHFDSLRQRNLNVALIMFTGLFGLGVNVGSSINLAFISIPLTILMTIFFLIDRKFHVYSHGYQRSSYKMIHTMSQIRNSENLEFEKYDDEYAKTAEWRNLQSIIYYCLITGSILSYFVLPYVRLATIGK